MKVKAECWINWDGEWHKPGEVFEAAEVDAGIMTVCDEPEVEQTAAAEGDETPRRGRKRKSDE